MNAQTQKQALTLQEAIDSIQPLSAVGFTTHAREPDGESAFVPASDSGFEYSGRIDFADPSAPVLIWQGSQVRFRFTGSTLALRFDASRGADYFNVTIDGKIHLLRLEDSDEYDYVLGEKLGAGEHEASLFKRNEAMYAQASFKGIILDKCAALLERPKPRALKIEFYGDSITAGACDEIPGADQYEDMAQHNNYTSYGAIAARALGAEYSNISYSGIGVCVSWDPHVMPTVWKNLYAVNDSPVHDFKDRPADIVVINLGQNDYGKTQADKEPFPADFAKAYAQLLRGIRAQYPNAWIVCAMGGMSAVKSSRDLNKAWNASLKEFASDPKVLSMTFRAFTYDHPRVDTHIKLARELESFIRKNVAMEGLDMAIQR
jgi:lysophospholipase L1-like esterase